MPDLERERDTHKERERERERERWSAEESSTTDINTYIVIFSRVAMLSNLGNKKCIHVQQYFCRRSLAGMQQDIAILTGRRIIRTTRGVKAVKGY